MKKLIIGCMATLPFMVACQNDILEDVNVNNTLDNSHGAELYAPAGTKFQLGESSATRATAAGWQVDQDIIGLAWHTGKVLAAKTNGTAYGNVPFVAQNATGGFVARTNLYVGNYVAYYPFDTNVMAEDDVVKLTINPVQNCNAAALAVVQGGNDPQYLFDTEVLLSNNFSLDKHSDRTPWYHGDHTNESGMQKTIDFKISRLNSRINIYNNVINVPALAKVTDASDAIPVKVSNVKIVSDNLSKTVKADFSHVPGISGMTDDYTWNGKSSSFLTQVTSCGNVTLTYPDYITITGNDATAKFNSKIAMPFTLGTATAVSYVVETNYGIVTVDGTDVVKHSYLTANGKTLAGVLASTAAADVAEQKTPLEVINENYSGKLARNIGFDVRVDMQNAVFANRHVSNSQELMECLAIAKALKAGGASIEPLNIILDQSNYLRYFEMTPAAAQYSIDSPVSHTLSIGTASSGIKMMEGGEVKNMPNLDENCNVTLANGQTWTLAERAYDTNIQKFIVAGTLRFNNFDVTTNGYSTQIQNNGTVEFTGTNNLNNVSYTQVSGSTNVASGSTTMNAATYQNGALGIAASTEYVATTGDIIIRKDATVNNSGKFATKGIGPGKIYNEGTINANDGSETYIYDNAKNTASTNVSDYGYINLANRNTKVSVSAPKEQGFLVYTWGAANDDSETYSASATDRFNSIKVTPNVTLNAIDNNLAGLFIESGCNIEWLDIDSNETIDYLQVEGAISVQRGRFLTVKSTGKTHIPDGGAINVGGTFYYGSLTTDSENRIYNNGGTIMATKPQS